MHIIFFLLFNYHPNKNVNTSSIYRSATLYLEPSFSNSAITQSVIQGTPYEITTTKCYTICAPKLYTITAHKLKTRVQQKILALYRPSAMVK